MTADSRYPEGRRFAFTILDDTDDTTQQNGRPIYELLQELGFRTTKTVWALDTPREQQGSYFAAETLRDGPYLAWVRELASAGFEIAFHNASMGSSTRERTLEALEFVAREFPGMPRIHCNHGQNRENLHWGSARYSSPELALLYRLMERFTGANPYEGHVAGSPYFWADVAAQRIDYVRRYAFARLDCGRIPPGGPYHDDRKPDIPVWFNTADAPNARAFCSLVTRSSIDALSASGSWCIVSTHLGKGFVREGRVDDEVREVLAYLATRPGWFVPVSDLLDHLAKSRGREALSAASARWMEYSHVADRVWGRLVGRD